jgi:transketolase
MKKSEVNELKLLSVKLRKDILKMVVKAGEGHIPSAYSVVELLAVLYSKILNINPKNPRNPERDRFILSKGHGCATLYSILAEEGFFSKDELSRYCRPGGILGGHPEMQKIPGVEVSTGSLGHGFPIGIGMALAAKLDDKSYRTFCIVGDGECNEGSIWEGAMSGAHFNLDNIIVIVEKTNRPRSLLVPLKARAFLLWRIRRSGTR